MTDAVSIAFADEALGAVELRDVTLRDGLQLTGKVLPTEHKLRLARGLLAAGVPSIEIGAMARPDLVPPMANTLEVVAGLSEAELERSWLWVATPRSIRRALDAGARNFSYCLSVSDAHNRANVGRSTRESVEAMAEAIALVHEVGGRIQLTLATTFTCPFEGVIAPERVLEIANDPATAGADDIVLCDTIGQAVPAQVAQLVRLVRAEAPPRRIAFHGHDTWGLGVANTLAAAQAGATMVDGALGGLGGCPFAPGASGNASSEDILFALRPPWLTPSSFGELLSLGEGVLEAVGERNRSRASEGARRGAETFEWVRRA
jgi:hydroxymethylglutaryl-CoA lyase